MKAIIIEQEGKQIRIQFAKDNKGSETVMQVMVFQDGVWVHIFEHDITEEV